MAGPKFDWNKFPSEGASGSPKKFDWNQFPAEAKKESGSRAEAQTALENYGDTMTLGYLPQLQAGAEKIMTPVLNYITGNNVESDDYLKARDSNRKRIEELSKENPKSALIGKVAGVVNQAPLLAGKAIQGVGALEKIASAAKAGAVLGAAQNPGDIEGEYSPLQIGDRAKNAAIGGAIGAAAQGVVEAAPYIKRGASNAADWFKEKAERAAFKSVGPYQRDVIKAASKDEVRAVGRTLIDEGILKGAPSYEEIAKRTSDRLGVKGKELEDIINVLSEEGDKLVGASAPNAVAKSGESIAASGGIDRDLIAAHLEKKLINPNEGIGGVAAKNEKFRQLIDEYKNKSGRFSNIKDNEAFKRAIKEEINWKRLPDADIPVDEIFNRELYSATRQGSEDAAGAVANHIGGDMPEKFKEIKKTYGNLASAEKMASTRAAKDSANRFLSPTDYLTGTAGMAYGASQGDDLESKLTGAALGAGVGLANRALRTRGNPVLSKGLDSVANSLLKIPKLAALAEKNPALFNSFVERIGLGSRQGAFEALPQGASLYGDIEKSKSENLSRGPADSLKGEDKWAQRGVEKLGIKDESMAKKLLQSKEGRRLLIEASDLPDGSKKLQEINGKISKGLVK